MKIDPPPPVPPRPPGRDRPFWSVMIPVYNPDDLLELTLRSVLDQDRGADRMEIVVVDDRSPIGRAAEIVARIGSDRVRLHVAEANVGLAGNWNRCIDLSRGTWVHILHQDDLVRPGFYERLERADTAEPRPGMACTAHRVIDGDGAEVGGSFQFRGEPGIVPDFLGRMLQGNHLQCPAIVVRRDIYERIGGFRDDLKFVLDWEMWVRLACAAPTWYDPEPLACWRNHASNESARLRREASIGRDILRGIAVIRRLPLRLADRLRVGVQMRRMLRDEQVGFAAEALRRGRPGAALAALGAAIYYDPTAPIRRRFWKQIVRGFRPAAGR